MLTIQDTIQKRNFKYKQLLSIKLDITEHIKKPLKDFDVEQNLYRYTFLLREINNLDFEIRTFLLYKYENARFEYDNFRVQLGYLPEKMPFIELPIYHKPFSK